MPPRKVSVRASQPKAMTTVTTTTSDLKDELLKWICERHATNGPLDRQLLRDKALELAASLGVTGFKCSEAWLTVFLKKNGFSPTLTNCNGPIFPDYRVWIDLLRSLITQYRHKDLFNVDELVMYSDLVPVRISSTKHDNGFTDPSIDLSTQTNRIGMLLCCNSSGTEKLRPLIIGSCDLEKSPINCDYHRNEETFITDDLFADWLADLNEKMAKSSRKILLLLSRERIRSLKNTPKLTNVNLLFFPKDFPTQLRPLRGDVFHCVKMIHRSCYAAYLRSSIRKWKAEEIVDSLTSAWREVPPELIVSSFQRTKFREDESFLKIECPAWEGLGTGMSFRRFVTFDDDLSETFNRLSDPSKSPNNNERTYNLRGNRGDTVELDVIEEINAKNAEKGRKAAKRTAESRREVTSDNQRQGSSGLSKKRRITEEIGVEDCQEAQQESRASETSGNLNSNAETMERSTSVEKIGDSLEINNSSFGETGNSRSPAGVSIEKDDSRRDETQQYEASGTRIDERLVKNFPGEAAGPSGEELAANDETSGFKKNLSADAEFDEGDEEIPVASQLKLTILEAIEYCKEIERSNDEDINHNRPGDADTVGTAKRSRNRSNDEDDEPTEKRAKLADESWSKKYETNFVFGPKFRDSSSQSIDASSCEGFAISKKNEMHANELEKRCIFTMDANAPGVSCPTTKD